MFQYSVLEKRLYRMKSVTHLEFFFLQSQIFPIMPCLVSKQHEHHILLGVLMDLSQPRLVTIQDKKTREREDRAAVRQAKRHECKKT